MAGQILQKHKDLIGGYWQVGDYAEIVDPGGGADGRSGDKGTVVQVNHDGSNNDLVAVRLENGLVSSRYGWRYRKICGEWDV